MEEGRDRKEMAYKGTPISTVEITTTLAIPNLAPTTPTEGA